MNWKMYDHDDERKDTWKSKVSSGIGLPIVNMHTHPKMHNRTISTTTYSGTIAKSLVPNSHTSSIDTAIGQQLHLS